MGKFNIVIPKEINELLRGCGEVDRIAPQMLNEAAPIVVKEIKAKAPVRTGELKKSVKASRAKREEGGGYIANINFHSGKDGKGRNMIKALVAEYGRKGRKDGGKGALPPRPFIRPAVAEATEKVIDKMQEVYNREVANK